MQPFPMAVSVGQGTQPSPCPRSQSIPGAGSRIRPCWTQRDGGGVLGGTQRCHVCHHHPQLSQASRGGCARGGSLLASAPPHHNGGMDWGSPLHPTTAHDLVWRRETEAGQEAELTQGHPAPMPQHRGHPPPVLMGGAGPPPQSPCAGTGLPIPLCPMEGAWGAPAPRLLWVMWEDGGQARGGPRGFSGVWGCPGCAAVRVTGEDWGQAKHPHPCYFRVPPRQICQRRHGVEPQKRGTGPPQPGRRCLHGPPRPCPDAGGVRPPVHGGSPTSAGCPPSLVPTKLQPRDTARHPLDLWALCPPPCPAGLFEGGHNHQTPQAELSPLPDALLGSALAGPYFSPSALPAQQGLHGVGGTDHPLLFLHPPPQKKKQQALAASQRSSGGKTEPDEAETPPHPHPHPPSSGGGAPYPAPIAVSRGWGRVGVPARWEGGGRGSGWGWDWVLGGGDGGAQGCGGAVGVLGWGEGCGIGALGGGMRMWGGAGCWGEQGCWGWGHEVAGSGCGEGLRVPGGGGGAG